MKDYDALAVSLLVMPSMRFSEFHLYVDHITKPSAVYPQQWMKRNLATFEWTSKIYCSNFKPIKA